MIARLTGQLVESSSDRVVVDVGGVGYALSIPLGTFTMLPPAGERVTLHVHTHVREDALQLYGFATAEERLVFERLLSVSGIGPKVALTVLSGLPLPELVGAITAQNVRLLSTIPGVGKKLAERLGVELKDRLRDIGIVSPVRGLAPRTSVAEDAVAALLNLGYKVSQAESAVAAAAREVPAENLNTLLQAALKSLAR